MANEQQLNLIRDGANTWNSWRLRNPFEKPDFRNADLSVFDFSEFDLVDADFKKAKLRGCKFVDADLTGANLSMADSAGTNFSRACLQDADLSAADLSRANFHKACLVGANLTGANLFTTIFRSCSFGGTILADVDLETARGLEEINHVRASSLSVDTIFRSGGTIPREFLQRAGLPPIFIDYIPSLAEANSGIHFHSCFISYSHQDEVFATRLWERLRKERIRVWYAPEEMQGGKKLFDQIERAISLHDKLLLLLSKSSMESNWVQTEIRKARAVEKQTGMRKLFPIRLVDFESIGQWGCFDADTGRDLAVEIREYFIPDFSRWMDSPSFEKAFVKLREALRAEGVR
jgi:hypothetical protein